MFSLASLMLLSFKELALGLEEHNELHDNLVNQLSNSLHLS